MIMKPFTYHAMSLSIMFLFMGVLPAMPVDAQARSLSLQVSHTRHHLGSHSPPRVRQRSHRSPRIGHRVGRLPAGFLRVVVGAAHFFSHHGVFYREGPEGYLVVTAPVGAVVKTIPAGYTVVRIGPTTYYHFGGTYYVWDDVAYSYVVVMDPTMATKSSVSTSNPSTTELFMYPKEGQSEDQQSKDRYACHRWGVEQTGFDPSLGDPPASKEASQNYHRAMTACLEARDYTVK